LLKALENKLQKLSNSNSFFSILLESEKINFGALVNFAKRNRKKFLFWAKPSEEYVFIAIDKILVLEKNKENLIPQLDILKRELVTEWKNNEINVPLVAGGVKFNDNNSTEWSDFTENDWFVPRYVFLKNGNNYYVVVNSLSEDSSGNIVTEFSKISDFAFSSDSVLGLSFSFPKLKLIKEINKTEWKRGIDFSLDLIKKNTLDKIVISRYVQNSIEGEVNYHLLLASLADNYPFCTIFGFNNGNSFFFGATPETLFRVNKNVIETDALAGSISRGKTIYEDENLSNQLLTSDKNLREHKKVVDFILTNLEKHARTVVYRDTPKIRKLKNIQHLWTPIKAQINKDVNLLSILYDLHPTPAVCGSPKEVAFEKINEIEKFSRGLFTGVIGWFNFFNEGDFSVAIRSALIKNNFLYAYAGCGIVEGSNAEEEFVETQLKLKPILNLFTEHEY